MATHSSILAWTIPRTEEPVDYGLWGHKMVVHDLLNKYTINIIYIFN